MKFREISWNFRKFREISEILWNFSIKLHEISEMHWNLWKIVENWDNWDNLYAFRAWGESWSRQKGHNPTCTKQPKKAGRCGCEDVKTLTHGLWFVLQPLRIDSYHDLRKMKMNFPTELLATPLVPNAPRSTFHGPQLATPRYWRSSLHLLVLQAKPPKLCPNMPEVSRTWWQSKIGRQYM